MVVTSIFSKTLATTTLVRVLRSFSAFFSRFGTSRKGISILGVLIDFEAIISISLNRGIPKVTFISPLPAKWNVLSVIWVDGSPIDWKIQIQDTYGIIICMYYVCTCAANNPTGSPGAQIPCIDFNLSISSKRRRSFFLACCFIEFCINSVKRSFNEPK